MPNIDIDPLTGAPIVTPTTPTLADSFTVPPTLPADSVPSDSPATTEPTTSETPAVEMTEVDKGTVDDILYRNELASKIQKCEVDYGGMTNIPLNHDYWTWTNEYRKLLSQAK